jgi:beta-xylosidase
VHPADFPDPFVLRAQGAYWAFATQRGLRQVPTLRSLDLVHWEEEETDALPRLPRWADFGHVWAPSVLARDRGFVMYYTTRHAATGLQCISRAVSVVVQGPYLDTSEGPLICQHLRGGSIDPDPFVDVDGQPWLLWKSEGTLFGEPTRIWTQRLSADGRSLVGEKSELLSRALPWEEPIIEGPAMAHVDGRYHLFYAGNRWETGDYAIGHALCDTPAGPCRRSTPGPVLSSRDGEAGPGSPAIVTDPSGSLVLAHHAWDSGAIGYPEGARRLHLSTLSFEGDQVVVGPPWRPEPFRLL